jgi:hypothetical protein
VSLAIERARSVQVSAQTGKSDSIRDSNVRAAIGAGLVVADLKNGIDRNVRFSTLGVCFWRTRTHGQTREFKVASTQAGPDSRTVRQQPQAAENDVGIWRPKFQYLRREHTDTVTDAHSFANAVAA